MLKKWLKPFGINQYKLFIRKFCPLVVPRVRLLARIYFNAKLLQGSLAFLNLKSLNTFGKKQLFTEI
jgi:hypothetical protein